MPTADAVREDMTAADWEDRLRAVLGTVRVTTPDGASPGGTAVTARLGHLQLSRVTSDAQCVARTTAAPPHDRAAGLLLVLRAGGTVTLRQDGGHAVVGAGDLLLYDACRPFSIGFGGPFTALVLRVPRAGRFLSDEQLRRAALVPVATAAGTASLLATFLSALAVSPGSYPPSVAERLAGAVVDLLSVLVAENGRPRDAGESEQVTLVRRIREHIDLHLKDPALSPRSIARDHHISVRCLHRAFQAEGVTVQRLIQQRRIEQSARELAAHEHRTLSIAAVALRWGFTNPAHFSRAFRRRYGCTPMEWRRGGSPG